MAKDSVNESSAYRTRVRFGGYTVTGVRVPITPETLRYRIRDVSNDRIVRDWTNITPGTYTDIYVTASENNIYNDRSGRRNHFEERVIAVEANFGTDDQFSDECRYLIKNLRGFES